MSPVLVNQRTALAVLGLTPRAFLATVKRLAVPHKVVRRLTLCRLDDVLAALGLPAVAPPIASTPPPSAPVNWMERAKLRVLQGGKGEAPLKTQRRAQKAADDAAALDAYVTGVREQERVKDVEIADRKMAAWKAAAPAAAAKGKKR